MARRLLLQLVAAPVRLARERPAAAARRPARAPARPDALPRLQLEAAQAEAVLQLVAAQSWQAGRAELAA